ncbi:MAG: Ig-like domain-containing protein [Myxococcota bacterium]
MFSSFRLPPLALCLFASASTGCFDPIVASDDESDGPNDDATETGGGNEASTSTSTTAVDSGSEAPADSTGTEDQPPELLTFTVDGSATPPELETSGLVLLEVDAIDDIGIDRVEFYEGKELIASVTEAPFQHEVLLISADNGTHPLSAIVFDTSEQSDASDPIPLSVNIAGGAMLELRESVATISSTFGFGGVPKLTTDMSDRIVLTGRTPLDPTGDAIFTNLYDSSLSLLWGQQYAARDTSMGSVEAGYYRPSLGPSEGQIVFGGIRRPVGGETSYNIYVLDSTTGGLETTFETRVQEEQVPVHQPVATTPDGWLYTTVGQNQVAKFSADFSREAWRSDGLGNVVLYLASTPGGGLVVTFQGEGCSAGEDICIRSLSSEGDTLWTRLIEPDETITTAYWGTQPSVSPNGNVAVPYSDDPVNHILLFDETGLELPTIELPEGSLPFEISYTVSNTLVVAATDGVQQPFDTLVAHYREDGSEIWAQTFSVGSRDSGATDLASTADGRLYVTGFADSGPPSDFLTDAWLAEIRL